MDNLAARRGGEALMIIRQKSLEPEGSGEQRSPSAEPVEASERPGGKIRRGEAQISHPRGQKPRLMLATDLTSHAICIATQRGIRDRMATERGGKVSASTNQVQSVEPADC